jgi:hypothetical protein
MITSSFTQLGKATGIIIVPDEGELDHSREGELDNSGADVADSAARFDDSAALMSNTPKISGQRDSWLDYRIGKQLPFLCLP